MAWKLLTICISARPPSHAMPLFALGLNYRTAPVGMREAMSFPLEGQREALPLLKRESGADEVVLVSTCNRSEIYLRGPDAGTLERATAWLDHMAPGRSPPLAAHLYAHREDAVARHAFRVACGLDSMVIGEPQILGQVKRAVQVASDSGTLGGHLDRLFQQTFAVAKEVRAGTEIGQLSVSMSAAALRLAQQVFGDLCKTRVLFLGAGEMIEQALTYFAAQSPLEIAIANRSLERAQALAARFAGTAMTLAQVPARIHEFDVVVSCTASSLPILGKATIEKAIKLRRRRPMFIVDLAMPRDVEPEVGEIEEVFLHTLDTLSGITQRNSLRRVAAIHKADAIIERRVAQFREWLDARAMVPAIRRLRGGTEHDRQVELTRAHARLARGEDPLQVLEALSLGLTNKFLHRPMSGFNRAAGEERELLAGALATLFLDPFEANA